VVPPQHGLLATLAAQHLNRLITECSTTAVTCQPCHVTVMSMLCPTLLRCLSCCRTATRRLRISGTPHQLHKVSLLFNTLRNNSIDDSRAVVTNNAGSTHPSDMQMRIDHRLQNSSGRTGSTSSVVQQLAYPAPTQPDLQLELGWNLQVAAPVLSMCKSFSARGSISSSSGSADKSSLGSSRQPETSSRKLLVRSCLPLRQLKAAYDCKAGSINLSVAGPSWNLSLSVPAETRGVLGLPVPCSGKSQGSTCWPKLVLTFSPDISTVAAT